MGRKKKDIKVDPWTYKGNPILTLEDFPKGTFGFIYEIEHKDTGQKYIGKKQLYSYSTKVSKILNEKTHRWNKVREKTAKESDWKTYFGSNIEIKDLVKKEGRDRFVRRILQFVQDRKRLTYYELAYQCKNDVLENPNYINSNILGKFFRSDFN